MSEVNFPDGNPSGFLLRPQSYIAPAEFLTEDVVEETAFEVNEAGGEGGASDAK